MKTKHYRCWLGKPHSQKFYGIKIYTNKVDEFEPERLHIGNLLINDPSLKNALLHPIVLDYILRFQNIGYEIVLISSGYKCAKRPLYVDFIFFKYFGNTYRVPSHLIQVCYLNLVDYEQKDMEGQLKLI